MFSQLTRYASELGIQIDDAEMDIRMSYDQRGKFGLGEYSPACSWVEYVLEVNSPAPSEKIKEMVELIERGCHTMNTLKVPVPVHPTVMHNGVRIAIATD